MPIGAERGRCVLAWLGAAVLLGAMAAPMFEGKVYLGDDLVNIHVPMRAFYARCLAAGHEFAWCPDLLCGFDLQGEGQTGMTHPLHRVLYGVLPLPIAFNLEILSSYAIAFVGTVLLLRRRGLARDASAFGAMFFAFAGYNLFHFHHILAVASAAHFPWLLLGIDGTLRSETARGRSMSRLVLAVVTASLLLIGYPQNVAYGLFLEGLYTAYVLAADRPGWGRLAGLVGAKLVGLLGGCAQVLPTWDWLKHTSRQSPTYEFLALGSLHPANLVQTLAPYLYKARVYAPRDMYSPAPAAGFEWRTGEFGLYNGAIVPLLVLYVMLRWRSLGRERRLASVCLGLAALGMLLAFGRFTPLYSLYLKIPLLNMFRVNARYVMFYHLATAALAAIAMVDLARQSSTRTPMPWRRAWLLGFPFLLAVAIARGARSVGHVWPGVALRAHQGSSTDLLIGVGLVAVATILVLLAARGRRGAMAGIILFTAIDLGVYGLTYVRHFQPGRIEDIVATTGKPPFPPPGTRVKLLSPFPDNTLALRGLKAVDGYVALTPKQVLPPDNPTTWRLSAAEWLLEDPWSARWSRMADPLPRVRLVTRAVATNDPGGDLNTIDHRSAALVPQDLGLAGDGLSGTAKLTAEQPGRLTLEIDAPTRQLLVIADRFHPGWQAMINGRAGRVIRVNGEFLGCVVEPGRHEILLHFAPWSHRVGGYLSLCGLGLMGLMLVRTLRARRQADPTRSAVPASHLGLARVRADRGEAPIAGQKSAE